MVSEHQVIELAYTLWEQEGKPEGKAQEHYFNARRVLEEMKAAQPVAAAGKPAARKRSASAATKTRARTGSASPRSTTRARRATKDRS